MSINFNDIDNHYQNVAHNATKNCIGGDYICVYAGLYRNK